MIFFSTKVFTVYTTLLKELFPQERSLTLLKSKLNCCSLGIVVQKVRNLNLMNFHSRNGDTFQVFAPPVTLALPRSWLREKLLISGDIFHRYLRDIFYRPISPITNAFVIDSMHWSEVN